MVELILLLIANSLLCVGVYVGTQWNESDTFDEDPQRYRDLSKTGMMVLWWIRYYISYLPEFVQKPVYKCLPCMASFWSIPVFGMFAWVNGLSLLFVYPLYILSLAGLNYILAKKYVY